MQPRYPLTRVPGLLLAYGALAGPSALAAQLDYRIDLGVEHNDNVNLSQNDPVSENIFEPQLAFGLTQQGSTVQATATGAIQYRDYLGGEFSDEVRGQLAGHLNWTVMPQRLNLTVEDYLSVQPVNPLQPNTPNNQQQTNVIAFGPTLDFRLGETLRGEADLRYVNSYADKTKQFNTQRAGGAVRVIKDIDPTSSVSGNVDAEHIHFTDPTGGPDYDRYSAYGRYMHNWTKVDLVADLGYSWLSYSGNQFADRNDPLGRATLNLHPTDRSTFTLDFAYQFSDAAAGLIATTEVQAQGPIVPPTSIATGDATTTSQAYLERRLGLGYRWTGERLTFNVDPYYRKLQYADGTLLATGLDETGRGLTGGVSYLLRPLLSVGLVATGENLRYDSIDREDKTWTLSGILRQQWTRNWSGRLELTHYKRDSNVPDQSFSQNIIYVALVYTR